MIFGCCIKSISEVMLVKKAGYDYFEFSGAELMKMTEEKVHLLAGEIKRGGIPCLGLNSYCSGIPAIVGEKFSEQTAFNYAEEICRRGDIIGIKNIGIGAPKARILPKDYPKDKADIECRKFIEITAACALKHGIRVLMEAVNDHMCDYMTTTEEVVRFVEQTDVPNLYIVSDFYNMEMMMEKPEEIRKTAPWLHHTHISTGYPGTARGFPDDNELEKYVNIFRVLKSMGYDESMSIEPNIFETGAAETSLKMLKKAISAAH